MCPRSLILTCFVIIRMSPGLVSGADVPPQPKRSVLIVDGVNNHDWERATRILKKILADSGQFTVGVATSPPATAPSEQWQAWNPDFARYDVVVMNFNGGHTPEGVHWPRDLEEALEDYVTGGGGLVSYHAANNSFPEWPAYNRMIGLGWRGKDFGPSLVVGGDGKVVEVPKGQGFDPGHGPEHDFVVTVRDAHHPITKGLPTTWLHPHEQLTHGQHGPAKDMTVLTYAYSKDTKQNEVMDWVIPFGQGRVYTTMLGHLWKDGPDTAMRCVGFQTMFIRGVEWAASGRVSYPVPEDFPTESQMRLRTVDRKPAPPHGQASGHQVAPDDKALGNDESARDQVPDEMSSEQLNRIMQEARTLTSRQVEEMAVKLKADPKDLKTRLLLISHAGTSRKGVMSRPDIDLQLGQIENHPTSSLSAELPRIYLTGPLYDEAAKTWLGVVKAHENDASVLGNAGLFLTGAIFQTTYRDHGETLLKKARSLEPTRPRWALALGTLYEMDGLRAGPVSARTTAARNALAEFEEGYRLTPEADRAKLGPEGRHIFQHMADAAMILGDLAKAGEHAEKLLATVNPQQDSWNYGNAIFEAHTILGRVALRRNDVKAACRHLIDSGRTPGSPQLNSFGPNMILADQLQERGEDKTGLEFLQLCGVFWLSGKDRLERWLQDVRDGRKPDFGRQSRP